MSMQTPSTADYFVSPAFESIRVEIDSADPRIGRLTLARPERLNAMGATMMREIAAAARWFDEQHDCAR